ncbi:hypothetical protein PJE062_2022 [Pseudovibrio sp. JE062]|nr:hypothetical protein PJE062_2022 [Pseudovibrio sp. JE062]
MFLRGLVMQLLVENIVAISEAITMMVRNDYLTQMLAKGLIGPHQLKVEIINVR